MHKPKVTPAIALKHRKQIRHSCTSGVLNTWHRNGVYDRIQWHSKKASEEEKAWKEVKFTHCEV